MNTMEMISAVKEHHQYCGGYHQYIGGCSVLQGYQQLCGEIDVYYCGGIPSVYWRVLITVEDTISLYGGFSTVGYHLLCGEIDV